MADQHEHCEPNQANWVGVRPGIDGKEILDTHYLNNSQVNMYTVPADTIFYLFDWSFGCNNSAGAVSLAMFRRYNSGAAIIDWMVLSRVLDDDSKLFGQEYYLPKVCPAGDYFRLYSSAVNFFVSATIHGVLVDV